MTGDLWEFLLLVQVSRANRAARPSPANAALKQRSTWHNLELPLSWRMDRFVGLCVAVTAKPSTSSPPQLREETTREPQGSGKSRRCSSMQSQEPRWELFLQSKQLLLSPGKNPGGRYRSNGRCGHRLQYKMSTEASVVLDRQSWQGSVEPVRSFSTSPMMKVLLIRYRPQ